MIQGSIFAEGGCHSGQSESASKSWIFKEFGTPVSLGNALTGHFHPSVDSTPQSGAWVLSPEE